MMVARPVSPPKAMPIPVPTAPILERPPAGPVAVGIALAELLVLEGAPIEVLEEEVLEVKATRLE
jgi:hypothetical protein